MGNRVLLVDLDTQESLLKFDALDEPNAFIVKATPKTLPKLLKDGSTADGFRAISSFNSNSAGTFDFGPDDSSFDFALLDCPPILDKEAAAALKSAHLVIAPTPPRYLDVAGFALLRQTVQEAAARGNPRLKLKILVTMRDARCAFDRSPRIRSQNAPSFQRRHFRDDNSPRRCFRQSRRCQHFGFWS